MEVNHFQIPLLAPRDGKSDTLDRSNDTAREMRVRRALLETLLHLQQTSLAGNRDAAYLSPSPGPECICFGVALLLYKEERAPEREREIRS